MRSSQSDFANLSLPVRGAWIEICEEVPDSRILASLPVRGAWIEISILQSNTFAGLSRSPCGERGLKSTHNCCTLLQLLSLPVRGAWIEISGISRMDGAILVAPRAGSVD